MLHSARSLRGMVTAPHHLAAQSGLDILKVGGNAVEAAVATAASLAVIYPHMTGIGGDAFWLIRAPNGDVTAIDASGRAAQRATPDLYAGYGSVPWRGGLAANTVAGTISGWAEALRVAQGQLPLDVLLRDAIHYAENGTIVTESHGGLLARHLMVLKDVPGFAEVFLQVGEAPVPGATFRNPALGHSLRLLAREGLDSFYRGALARSMANDLQAAGSPLRLPDFQSHQATRSAPLHARLKDGCFYNTRPPTQGTASLLILALAEHWGACGTDTVADIHLWVEATKLAFLYRDSMIADPALMTENPQGLLDDPARIAAMAGPAAPDVATPWPRPTLPGDTTWFGVMDSQGWAVSMIQSLYFEFGSGVTLPESGIIWQNRGSSFDLTSGRLRSLAPGRKPFHTLNPALAVLNDGSVLSYGTMGGEGQPQTQSAIVARVVRDGMSLQAAISAPRWLLGRTWGETSTTLKLEARFAPEIVDGLRSLGHDVELMGDFEDAMGHAGALRRYADGMLEGASDPRSNGGVAAW